MPCPPLLRLLVLLSQEACPSTFCCPLLLSWAGVSFGHRQPAEDKGVSDFVLFSKMGLMCSVVALCPRILLSSCWLLVSSFLPLSIPQEFAEHARNSWEL